MANHLMILLARVYKVHIVDDVVVGGGHATDAGGWHCRATLHSSIVSLAAYLLLLILLILMYTREITQILVDLGLHFVGRCDQGVLIEVKWQSDAVLLTLLEDSWIGLT
jgi:hypothetical protein